MSKKQNQLINSKIDEKNRKILRSDEPRVLYANYLLDYSKKTKKYLSKWCKLTNDGELLLFADENAKEMERMFDLVSVYDGIEDKESEFILTSESKHVDIDVKPNHSFRCDDGIEEWI